MQELARTFQLRRTNGIFEEKVMSQRDKQLGTAAGFFVSLSGHMLRKIPVEPQ
jgi:hypothetical protein